MGMRGGWEWAGDGSLLALAAFHCSSSPCPVVFFFLLLSYSLLGFESMLCSPEALESPCVFCPERNSLVLYLVICWLCGFLALLYTALLCANLTTQLITMEVQ